LNIGQNILLGVIEMPLNKTTFNINKQQYTREVMYEGIHVMIQYSRDADGEFGLDAVLTPDGQNITDLVRIQALKYFESLLRED
jgi:hypothetical protein